jgi:hypothetical protein
MTDLHSCCSRQSRWLRCRSHCCRLCRPCCCRRNLDCSSRTGPGPRCSDPRSFPWSHCLTNCFPWSHYLTNCLPSSRCLRSRCWESSVEQNCPEYRMNLCSSRYCLFEQSRTPPRVIQGLRSGEYASSLSSFLSFNAVCDKCTEPPANAVVSPSTPLKRVKRKLGAAPSLRLSKRESGACHALPVKQAQAGGTILITLYRRRRQTPKGSGRSPATEGHETRHEGSGERGIEELTMQESAYCFANPRDVGFGQNSPDANSTSFLAKLGRSEHRAQENGYFRE